MSKFLAGVLIVSSLGLVLSYQNCGTQQVPMGQAANANPNESSQTLDITGTVTQSQLDGCNLLVQSQNSSGAIESYIPVGISGSTAFQPGNVVKLEGYIRTDMATACMAGQIFQVTNAQVVK